jgi:hypothetical protein
VLTLSERFAATRGLGAKIPFIFRLIQNFQIQKRFSILKTINGNQGLIQNGVVIVIRLNSFF